MFRRTTNQESNDLDDLKQYYPPPSSAAPYYPPPQPQSNRQTQYMQHQSATIYQGYNSQSIQQNNMNWHSQSLGSSGFDPSFTQAEFNNPIPSYSQPPYSSFIQPTPPTLYGHSPDNSDRGDYHLQVDPTNQQRSAPQYKLSNCEGRKKALLIGINYFNSSAQLNGCISDANNMKNFITTLYGFKEEDMVILTDDQHPSSKLYPTRANILAAMQWLVSDSQPNDSYFFHFSGHGGRVEDVDGDEDDGYDETIYPVDHDKYEGESGQIIDDLMHDIMVKPLCEGCRLTCIFDSCYSGSALDLPFMYSTKGLIKEQNIFKDAGKGLLQAGFYYATGNKARAISSLVEAHKNIKSVQAIEKNNRTNKYSAADVIMFSGCKDSQTSADVVVGDGRATGAMSYAFTTVLRENPDQSYYSLLNSVRDILHEKYSQRPQLSASHPIDVNSKFVC